MGKQCVHMDTIGINMVATADWVHVSVLASGVNRVILLLRTKQTPKKHVRLLIFKKHRKRLQNTSCM